MVKLYVSEPVSKCDCPFLRMVARAERMMGCGILPGNEAWMAKSRVTAIHVGVERDERGCAGPVGTQCRLNYEASAIDIMFDPNIPVLKRRIEDGQDHFYN